MRVTVTYKCDWISECAMHQIGHISIKTPTGLIEATWEVIGGKGRGAGVVTNTTQEYNDEEAGILVNLNNLCQGYGTYDADLSYDPDGGYNGFALSNVSWHGPQKGNLTVAATWYSVDQNEPSSPFLIDLECDPTDQESIERAARAYFVTEANRIDYDQCLRAGYPESFVETYEGDIVSRKDAVGDLVVYTKLCPEHMLIVGLLK